MTDKLDAATIRELLAKCEPEYLKQVSYLDFEGWKEPYARLFAAAPAIARYALELSDKVESQAAELERLRKALTGMVENFSEFACEDTERWREEHQAYENALVALELYP